MLVRDHRILSLRKSVSESYRALIVIASEALKSKPRVRRSRTLKPQSQPTHTITHPRRKPIKVWGLVKTRYVRPLELGRRGQRVRLEGVQAASVSSCCDGGGGGGGGRYQW